MGIGGSTVFRQLLLLVEEDDTFVVNGLVIDRCGFFFLVTPQRPKQDDSEHPEQAVNYALNRNGKDGESKWTHAACGY